MMLHLCEITMGSEHAAEIATLFPARGLRE